MARQRANAQRQTLTLEDEVITTAKTFAVTPYRGQPSASDGIRQAVKFADEARTLLKLAASGQGIEHRAAALLAKYARQETK